LEFPFLLVLVYTLHSTTIRSAFQQVLCLHRTLKLVLDRLLHLAHALIALVWITDKPLNNAIRSKKTICW
jgi:hypothetical protein